MGGSSYDRDVYRSSSSSNWGASTAASKKMSSTVIDKALKPVKTIKSTTKFPVIIVLDVTGSNIDFAKIIYDKLPMLYGQIEQKGYLPDFDLSICAVGDAYTDSYPMQIGDFAKGIALDPIIEKIVLESGGGGQDMESYELMAWYMLNKAKFEPDAQPLLFFIGDESFYPSIDADLLKGLGFDAPKEKLPSSKVFSDLFAKFNDNVFMMLNKYGGRDFRDRITHSWEEIFPPEHVIKIKEEKSIVDMILGIIAMLSNSRSLDSYTVDMLDRGQTTARIDNVKTSLKGLEKAMVPVASVTGLTVTKSKKTKKATKRI